jgi:hypothetical protein
MGRATERGLNGTQTRLSRLNTGEQLTYAFDMGDDWTHLCTVTEERIDPLNEVGIVPDVPLPYWGWGPPRPV